MPKLQEEEEEEQATTDQRQPCAFFLKTGSCAFGDQCKFEHPADQPPPQYNSLGLPLRPGEPECAYYAKNLHCGYGASCKFHHSEPAVSWVPVPMMEGYAMRARPTFPVLSPYSRVEGNTGLAPSYAPAQSGDALRMSSQPAARAQSLTSSQSQASGPSYAHAYPQSYAQSYASTQAPQIGVVPQHMAPFTQVAYVQQPHAQQPYVQQMSQQMASLQLQRPGAPERLQQQGQVYQQASYLHPQVQAMMQPRYLYPQGSGHSMSVGMVPYSQQMSHQSAVLSRPSSSSQGFERAPSDAFFQSDAVTQSQQPASRLARTSATSTGGPSRSRLNRSSKEAKS